ncbi:MAG TPA: ABC transporter permease [Terracidiphilus sp.]|nr:ABC transporter permease [Terracidiphilus sp.]
MNSISRFVKKLALLFGRDRYSADLDEEMAFHREQAEREFVAGGMMPEAARYAAMRQFGNATRMKERSHEVVGFKAETVVQDLRFALRQLRKNPGFALTAIMILALGMGVSVAIFGFVDAALLEPLPYAAPNRLMDVDENSAMFPRSNLSRDDYEDWKRLNHSFTSLEVYGGTGYLLRTPSGPVPVPAGRVSDGFFRTLGVKPMLGRDFLPGEDRPGQAKILILSYGTWLTRYGGRRDIVGQAVNLNEDSYTIIGVLPREFSFAPRGNAEFWVPLLDKNGCEVRRSCHNLYGVGRLRDGVTQRAALEEMTAIAAQLAVQYPGSNQGQGASVMPLSELIVGKVRPILFTLLSAAGLLLLIACVNVASLLLVRSEARRREIAVRGALGATRVRLARQFVTEGLLLAAVGCIGGIIAAGWVMTMLKRLVPKAMADGMPFLSGVGVNAHTGMFAGAVALAAALLMAATPVLRLSFQDIREGLGDGGRAAAGRFWRRMGANLVVMELSVAMVLLVGAGLLGKSFYRLLHVENGFDTTHLATVQVAAPDSGYPKTEQKVALYRAIGRRLSSLPGVQSVGITSDLPVQCNCDTDWIRIVGKPFHGEHNEVDERDVSPGYLPTLKARLVRGRLFTEDDDASKGQKIVINEALAEKYFPGEDPIGQKVGNGDLDPKSMREIIGVIANVREGGLDDELWPAEYQALYQSSDTFFAVAVRTTPDEKAALPVLVKALHEVDPNLGTYGEITMTDQIESTQTALLHRLSTWLVGGFAGMALVLGVVGLYGVIAYSVSQRTREIGVRMALGAQRSSVYQLVLGEAGRLIVVGVVVGLAGAVGAAMLMRKLLFGVQVWDAGTLLGVAVVLGASAMLASYFPARRAASVNPTEALRAE